MSVEELGVHDEQADDELSVGPQRALVDEEASVAFVNEARRPGFWSPRGVEIFLEEESQLVGIRHGNDLDVAALVVGLHAVSLEPVAQGNVLRVAKLRRRDPLAVEVFWFVDAGIAAHNQGSAAAGSAGHDAKSLAIRANVAVDRRVWADVGHVNRSGEQSFDGGRPGVETGPLNLDLRAPGPLQPAVGFADHCLGVRDVGERADTNSVDGSLGPSGNY